MKTTWIPGDHGYDIPCEVVWTGEKKLIIAAHGFGSSKGSPMIQALNTFMPPKGIGVISFDFPAHGESPAGQEGLRVPFAIDDLAAVERYAHELAPQAEILYFGSSFGAYITLLFLSRGKHLGKRAFLRSSAVTMPKLVDSWLNAQSQGELAEKGYFVPDHDYIREIRVTPEVMDDLHSHDVFARYQPGEAELCMIHGAKDSVAPPEDAAAFAREKGAKLIVMPNGEHNLMGEGELDQVLDHAAAFFLSNQ